MINPLHKAIGQHFDDDWRFHAEPGDPVLPTVLSGPDADLQQPIPEPEPEPELILTPGEELTEAEVVKICREHFATFGTVAAAAKHYGLSVGRLHQIQVGIHVGCPRVLSALGIKRDRRTRVYRAVANDSIPAPEPPEKPAPTTGAKESAEFIANWVRNFDHIPSGRKPHCARPKAGDLQLKKQSPGVVRVGLATRQHMLVDGECDAEYLQGLRFGGAES